MRAVTGAGPAAPSRAVSSTEVRPVQWGTCKCSHSHITQRPIVPVPGPQRDPESLGSWGSPGCPSSAQPWQPPSAQEPLDTAEAPSPARERHNRHGLHTHTFGTTLLLTPQRRLSLQNQKRAFSYKMVHLLLLFYFTISF